LELGCLSSDGGKGLLVELACETDFVAKGEKFVSLAEKVADAISDGGATTVEDALKAPMGGSTVEEEITNEAAILGEKVELRKVAAVEDEQIDAYMHRTSKDLPPQVGVLLAFSGGDASVAHDVAVHIAAFSPEYMSREDVPQEIVEKERSIAEETARNEGKPEQALAKIVEGRVTGFFKESVLLEQAFAKDPKQSVGQVLENAGVKVSSFVRVRVGA
jgi:translation elongation factor Ts